MLLLGALAGLAWLWRRGEADEQPPPPPSDVILIVVDTLRADRLGAYGYPLDTTPFLDSIAAEGVVFDSHYSTSPWTRPSLASLATGLYPRSAGIYEEQFDSLAEDLPTLAETMARRGYRTLGLTANPNVNSWFGFARGFDFYGDSGVVWPWMPATDDQLSFRRDGAALETGGQLTVRALQAAERLVSSEGVRQPIFLQVLYVDPHRPYSPPTQYLQRLVDAGSQTPDYDGEIRYTDDSLSHLASGLEELGIGRDALWVVTSDHGEGLDDHPEVPDSKTHGPTLYDSVLRVPLIIRHPRLPGGRIVSQLTSSVDVVPTILEFAGVSRLPDMPGRSLLPLVAGRPERWTRQTAFAETEWRAFSKISVRTAGFRAIWNVDAERFRRSGKHKRVALTENERAQLSLLPEFEVYDRDGRPEAPEPDRLVAQPERLEELQRLLDRWQAATPARPPIRRDPAFDVWRLGDGTVVPRQTAAVAETEGETATIHRDLEAQLRALGYLDGK